MIMAQAGYTRRHDEIMVEVHESLEDLVEAMDEREQRIEGRVDARHVARIAAARDRLRGLVAELREA